MSIKKTDGPFKDKNGRVLEEGDIVKIAPELREITGCCWKDYGHIWLAEPWNDDDEPVWEWVISYNHTYSEVSDRLREIPPEWLEFFRKAKPDDSELDF